MNSIAVIAHMPLGEHTPTYGLRIPIQRLVLHIQHKNLT